MKFKRTRHLAGLAAACALAAFTAGAQQPPKAALNLALPALNPQQAANQAAANANEQPALTLQDALALARKNSTAFNSALTDAGLAREDKIQSRDSLLPSVNFNTSATYTQLNAQGNPKFIANNGSHEYISQGNVHESLALSSIADYRRTAALAAAAKARAEIARRGLVVTVVQAYFGVLTAQSKLDTAHKTASEGESFLQLTQQLEKGGEVARADVIKAELQVQDRRRQLQEAQLGLINARLDFSVLVFPDFRDNFTLADDLHADVPLPLREEFESQTAHENPEIRAAMAASEAAGHDVFSARSGYLPSIGLDYFYGIDADRYAVNSPTSTGKVSNLGSSAIASLNLPVWNWGATQSRVRQAELRRNQAHLELSYAQRKLLAETKSLYAEAETARNELAGLQRSAELAADSLRLTVLRYKNGEATVLEVVDAQSTFALTNAAYQDGALRYRVALANLQTLTGVLSAP